MNLVDAHNYLVQQFDSAWLDTPIEYSNTRLEKDNLESWVRFSIRFGPSWPIDLQQGTKHFGTIYIQVFTKPNIGAGQALTLAQTAANLFAAKIENTIVFQPADLRINDEKAIEGLGNTEIAWFHVTAAVDFYFFE